MASTGPAGHAWSLPRSAARAARGSPVCPGSQTAGARPGGACLAQSRVWRSKPDRPTAAGIAGEYQHQYEFCGTGEPDLAATLSSADPRDERLFEGPRLVGKASLVGVGVLPFGVAAYQPGATLGASGTDARYGNGATLTTNHPCDGGRDHGSSMDDGRIVVLPRPSQLCGSDAYARTFVPIA